MTIKLRLTNSKLKILNRGKCEHEALNNIGTPEKNKAFILKPGGET